MTLALLRKNKKFLNYEQEFGLITILTKGCRIPTKRLITEGIRNRFYSLEDRDYWKQFQVLENGIEFMPKKDINKEISGIRKDILKQWDKG